MTTAEFDPEDWYERLKRAGGAVRIYKYHIGEPLDFPPTRECEVIWNEIKGEQNCYKADAVYTHVRAIAEPFEDWTVI